jgi:high-affinity nickel-transport protein
MTALPSLTPTALTLLFLLGMRHGLDPDHIAVIDNITFRAMDERPKAARWTGFLFSWGHGISVMVIAVLFGFAGRLVSLPAGFATVMSYVVIGLLLLVGTLNLRALLSKAPYTAKGWRHAILPARFKGSTHPMVTIAVGVAFGLVVDTAAQVATWGATAAAAGGIPAAALIGMCFAAGMILTDSADSFVVAALLQGAGATARVGLYRRRVGWLIVALSYGMAGVGLVNVLRAGPGFDDGQALTVGAVASGVVIAAIAIGNGLRSKAPKREL